MGTSEIKEKLDWYIGKPFKRKGPYGWSLQSMICKDIKLGITHILIEDDGNHTYTGEGERRDLIVESEQGTIYDYSECVFLYKELDEKQNLVYHKIREISENKGKRRHE